MNSKLPMLSIEDITIIIPTLNEAQALGKVIDELREGGFNNIIVVDGRSSDGTAEIARSKGVHTILQEGEGKANAVKDAIAEVETPYLLIMDGDYTYDPKNIKRMMTRADSFDEVIAARIRGRNNIPFFNRLGNKIITSFFNLLFGTNLRDVLSGMYLIKTDIAKDVWFEFKGFSIEVELATHIATTSRKITEISGNYRPRLGQAKLGKIQGVSIILDVLRLALRYNPTFLIFGAGSLFTIPAALLLLWVMVEYLIHGIEHFVWAIIGVSVGGVGMTSMLLAILALYMKRMEFRLIERLSKADKNGNNNHRK